MALGRMKQQAAESNGSRGRTQGWQHVSGPFAEALQASLFRRSHMSITAAHTEPLDTKAEHSKALLVASNYIQQIVKGLPALQHLFARR